MTDQSAFKAAGLQRPVQTKLFIGGAFVDAADGATFDVFNPCDNTRLCKVAQGGVADIDRAVAVAKEAQVARGRMDAADRGHLLMKLADAIEAHTKELIILEALDTGHPVRDARKLDVPRTARCFRYFGGMADKIDGFLPPVYPGFVNCVQREPLGVVGQIIPWNFPLMFTSWKMAPALATGNSIVLKPAEITPLTVLWIAELMKEVGIPAAVGGSAWVIFHNRGQACIAGSRLIVHKKVADAFTEKSAALARSIKLGNQLDPATEMGPLTSKRRAWCGSIPTRSCTRDRRLAGSGKAAKGARWGSK